MRLIYELQKQMKALTERADTISNNGDTEDVYMMLKTRPKIADKDDDMRYVLWHLRKHGITWSNTNIEKARVGKARIGAYRKKFGGWIIEPEGWTPDSLAMNNDEDPDRATGTGKRTKKPSARAVERNFTIDDDHDRIGGKTATVELPEGARVIIPPASDNTRRTKRKRDVIQFGGEENVLRLDEDCEGEVQKKVKIKKPNGKTVERDLCINGNKK